MPPDEIQTPPAEPVISAPAQSAEPPQLLPERDPFWGYADVGLALLLIVVGVVVINLVAAAIVFADPKLQEDLTPLILPTNIALYGIIYLALRLVLGSRYGAPVFRSLGWRQAHFNLAVAGIAGVALALALSFVAALIHTPQIKTPFDKLSSSPASLIFLGIMAVVLAPIFEELLFRGFLQPVISRSVGTLLGVVLTAVLFGLLHAPEYSWAWQYAVSVTLAGIAFGWLRAKTNSIIPGVVMHGCFNGIQVIAFAVTKLK